jgi:hypothetical protein
MNQILKKYVDDSLLQNEEGKQKKNENSEYVFENEKEIASQWLIDMKMNEVQLDIIIQQKPQREIEMRD